MTDLEPGQQTSRVPGREQHFWITVASTGVVRVYALAVSLLMVTITARWLGPAGQGVVAAATTWATLFGMLASLSLGQVAMHRATERRREQWLGETLGTLLALAAVATVACWSIGSILYVATDGRVFSHLSARTLMLASLLVPFVVWEAYGGNLLVAIDKIAVYNRAQLAGRSIGLALMLGCWRLNLPPDAAILVAVISQAVAAVGGMRELFAAAVEGIRARVTVAKDLVVGGLKLHFNAIGTFVFVWLPVLLVHHFRGPTETGLYQFASALITVLLIIPTSVAQVLSARVAREGPDQGWAYQRRAFLWLILLMSVVGAIAAAAAPMAIALVAGPAYAPAVPVFRLLLLSLIGQTFSATMGSQWIGRGLFGRMSVVTLFTSSVHAILSVLWISRDGMYGAVWATLVTSGLSVVINGTFALICEVRFRRHVAQDSAGAVKASA